MLNKMKKLNPFSTEPVLQIPLLFTCSNMGALICNYLTDEASGCTRIFNYESTSSNEKPKSPGAILTQHDNYEQFVIVKSAVNTKKIIKTTSSRQILLSRLLVLEYQ
jgi:hypothetical protein